MDAHCHPQIYDCEAHQILEIIKQKVLQLEPVQGSYRACKFSHTFPMEKPFNYSPLQLWSEHMLITCMYVVTMCQYIISAT